MTTEPLTREEFCRRFKAEMLRLAGKESVDEDGVHIADYADEAASTYWNDTDQRIEGPEACAEADISYWGD